MPQVTRDRHQVAECRVERGQRGIAVDAAAFSCRGEAVERRTERGQHRVVVDDHVSGGTGTPSRVRPEA